MELVKRKKCAPSEGSSSSSSFIFPHRDSWCQRVVVIFCVIIIIISFLGACHGASLPDDYLPQIQMLEIISSPTNRTTAVNLWKERNSDVIIGEDTSPTSRILMKCNATYPVQWVYLGDGNPEFTTFTNVRWQEDPNEPMSFEAEASLGLLGFQGVLREEDTGNYTCRSIQEPGVHSYYYIYVPGDSLFAAPNGTNLTYSSGDFFLRIPCGVSNPKATVTLCKKDKNDKLTCPVTGASSFNVKGGFLLNLKRQRNPSGTYVCTASYGNMVRTVEHIVMKEGEKPKPVPPVEAPPTYRPKPGKNLCDPSPCGKQAECSVVDGRAVCYCFRGLNGDPYDECAPGKCRSSRECPRGKFCRQGQCTSDPCNPSPCGKGGDCKIYRGQSKCSCQNGYAGLPPNCVKSCTDNFDCGADEACIKTICQSPCPGPCGQNAECRILSSGAKRTAQCSCPSGSIGDPLKLCYKFNSTTPGPWNNCPPGYVGLPPACKKKECNSDLDCPFGRKCNDSICEKGFDPSCVGKCGMGAECIASPTTSDSICICPAGTSGNPMIQCFGTPLSPLPPTTWGDPCFPNPCQSPAECHVVQGSRTCVCPPGATGNPQNCVRIQIQPNLPSSPFPTSGTKGWSSSTPCRHEGDCRQGEKCVDGRCQDLPHSSHFPSTGTTAWSNSPHCRHDGDCKQGEKCVEGKCQVLPSSPFPTTGTNKGWGSNTLCRHEGDCRQGEQCVDGRCHDRSSSHFPSTGTTAWSSTHCRHDGDCKQGERCADGKCQGQDLSPPPASHFPSTGTTAWSSTHCRHDGDCKQGEKCSDGKCQVLPSSPFPTTGTTAWSSTICRHEGDCKQGESCVDGRCQDPCNDLCGYNAICEPGYQRKYRSISSSSGKLLRSQPESRCLCPPGHEGNPYVSCIPIRSVPPPPAGPPSSSSLPSSTTSGDPVCFPNPCGKHAECSIVNNGPLCHCLPGYEGDPYQECRYPILSPPPNEYTPTAQRPITSMKTTPMSPSDLDYQGRSWGHHTGIITRDPPPPMSDGDGSYFNNRRPAYPESRPPSPPYHENRPSFPPAPPPPAPPPPSDNSRGQENSFGHPPPYLPDPTSLQVGNTPTPKTLGRPMSPLDTPAPMFPPPPDDVRDECTFKNPYADYDMDSCGVGHRCERDFRGIKRCVCISPFDCTGPTSSYLGNKCLTTRDCLLSEHICINGTCKNPCSPAHSPCADVAHSECRVIEGNVLCTCRRGYVGNPASGLDCRPKRGTTIPTSGSPVAPSSVAVLDQNNRKLIIIHGIFRNNSNGQPPFDRYNFTNSNNLTDNSVSVISSSFDSESGSGSYYDSEEYNDDDYDIVISSGTTNHNNSSSSTNSRYHRRHNNDSKQAGLKKKDLLLGQCGFGSGRNCDEKSHCKVIDGIAVCVCKQGYKGEFPYCKPECESHAECPEALACQYHQCMDPCIEEQHFCAKNAVCRVANHTATCACVDGFVGVPWIQCTKVQAASKDGGCLGFNCEKRKSGF